MAQRIPTSSPSSIDSSLGFRVSDSSRHSNRLPSHSPNASRAYHRGALPLTIPNSSRPPSPPPPLPPPPFNRELEAGNDIYWEWSNQNWKRQPGSRAVSPGTTPWDQKGSREHRSTLSSELWDSRRRESSASTSTVRSPTGTDAFTMSLGDEGYNSLPGVGSFLQLQGERPLEKQNRKDSSHAYDNHLKAKMGGPRTPTRSSTAGSIDPSPAVLPSRASAQAGRPPRLNTLSLSDRSLSASSDSPFRVASPASSRFTHSPQSSLASPGTDFRRTPISSFGTTSVASSRTSLGGSSLNEMAGEHHFGRVKLGNTRPKVEKSYLTLAAKAVEAANSAAAAAAAASASASASLSSSSSSFGSRSSRQVAETEARRAPSQRQRGRGGRGSRGVEAGVEAGAGAGARSGGGGGGTPGMFNRASFEHGNPNINTTTSTTFTSREQPETADFPLTLAETGGDMRHLQLDDYYSTPPPQHSFDSTSATVPRLHSQPSRSGMKRRASSPPTEVSPDERQAASAQAQQQPPQGAAGEQQRRTPGQHHPFAKRATPVFQHLAHPNYSSYSPDSAAGLSTIDSYASNLSVGLSSITSPSAQDRLSPAATMPKSLKQESHASPYMSSLTLDPGLQGLDVQSQPQFSVDATQQLAAAAAQKVHAENASRMKQQNPPKHSASHHICDCCPKKPKKFDTVEELRQHQAEKQYVCQYCHNRFKNKNEAERHQNSLHLRRHSWSCATLERNFEAAFHPCTATPPNTSGHVQPQHPPGTIAPFDVCGYCGEEFPNLPQPDWLARGEHLTNVHKFSECNQSKKFYRADHFRQHLKHSHGGNPGKWTNMLEAACMKEEPPVTPEAQNQEQLRLQQQQAQAAHAAQAAQAAVQQAQQAVQEAPVLTHYQAAQLQSASGAPVANMMGQSGLRQGPYPAMSMVHHAGNVQFGTIPEEEPKLG